MSDYKFVFSTLAPSKKIHFHTDKPNPTVINRSIRLEIPEGPLTLEYCERGILETLLRCAELEDFVKLPPRSRAEQYFQHVKNPMDLTMLQERLYTGQITTVDEFKRDLDLIWTNCRTFYGEQHGLSCKAKEAQDIIEDTWIRNRQPLASNALESVKALKEHLEKSYAYMAGLLRLEERPVIPPLKRPKKIEKPKEVPVEKPKVVIEVPNNQQRKLMAEKITRGSVAEMRKVWDIIKPHINDESQESKTFSLNALPDDALIELKKLLLA